MKTYSEFSGELEESVDESKFADTVKFVPGRNLQWGYPERKPIGNIGWKELVGKWCEVIVDTELPKGCFRVIMGGGLFEIAMKLDIVKGTYALADMNSDKLVFKKASKFKFLNIHEEQKERFFKQL